MAGLLPDGDPTRERLAAGAPAGMAAAALVTAPPADGGGGTPDGARRGGAGQGGRSTVAADVAAHLEAGLKQRR